MYPKAKKRLYRSLRMAVLTSFLLTACAAFMAEVEEPGYNVVYSGDDQIEIRQYPALVVAETTVPGPREGAMKQGFRTLADYIFGKNESGEKIAMTAPVTLQSAGKNAHRVRFVMPKEYSLKNLPKPENDQVTLRHLKGAKVAAIRFSGLAMGNSEKQHLARLRSFVTARGLVQQEPELFARYDPPWTLPFLRRNEVLIVVK